MIEFFLAHLLGDYNFQTNHMASKKTLKWRPAFLHGFVYTSWYFVLLQPSWAALAVIGLTHVVIDHYRIAKPLIWAWNQLAPKADRYPWSEAKENNGYSKNVPEGLSLALMIICDNTWHLLINFAAIKIL